MDTEFKKRSIKQYWPLFLLILASMLSAFAINAHIKGDMRVWIHYFMGNFFVLFSVVKLFHPIKFVQGFTMYDILAKRIRLYAYVYPLLELLLGLLYLSFFIPVLTYLLTVVLLTFSSIGAINALKTGLDINTPYMGSDLDVPLSTVTLIESIGMAFMALILLLTSAFQWLAKWL